MLVVCWDVLDYGYHNCSRISDSCIHNRKIEVIKLSGMFLAKNKISTSSSIEIVTIKSTTNVGLPVSKKPPNYLRSAQKGYFGLAHVFPREKSTK